MNSLHYQRIDHDLGTTLRGIQNHTHGQCRLVAIDDKRIGKEDGSDNKGIEDEVGNTTML